MAKCKRCKMEMCDERTTTCKNYDSVDFPDGAKTSPVPYTPPDPEVRCHDCNIAAGGFHHDGCDMEICPRCGGQFFGCSCFVSERINDEEMTYEIESAVQEIFELGIEICLDTGNVPYAAFFFSHQGKYCEDRFNFTNKIKAIKFIRDMIAHYQAKIVVIMSRIPLCEINELPTEFSNSSKEIMYIYGEDENTNLGILLEYWQEKDGDVEIGNDYVLPEGRTIGQLKGFFK